MSSTPIAFILKGYPRVSETFIAQEIYLLEKQGFDISIFSMRKARESERQPITKLIKAPVIYAPEYIWPAFFSVMFENFKALMTHPAQYTKWGCIAVFRSLKKRSDDPLKRFLQACWYIGSQGLGSSSPVRHLHSHFAHAPTEMAFYMSKVSGLSYSISAHAKDIYTVSSADLIERVQNSKLLMTCTSFNVDYLCKLPGIDKNKIHLAYHGIDLDLFKSKNPRLWVNKNLQNLISVGRLVQKKGYPTIFKALHLLKTKGHHFHYHIIGSGEDYKKLTELAQELELSDRVTFYKTMIQPQIIELMQTGGIYLIASQITADGDRDGIPNTVAEAMAMELPVIATNVSGIPELIEHNHTGLLVEPEDPNAYAQAIEKLWSAPEIANQISHQARLKVESVFNNKKWIATCASHLKKAIQS
jgi:glycosyltransferase involved in cell wall biosynthesis